MNTLLPCLQQQLLSPTMLPKMEQRFRELASRVQDRQEADQAIAELRAKLAGVQMELKTITENMARAKTDAQYDAISVAFEQLMNQEGVLLEKIAEEQARSHKTGDAEQEITKAMDIVHRLADLAADASNLDLAGQAFKLSNAKLFLRFRPTQVKKRLLNKVADGVVTFGAAAPPIQIYSGPTGRRALIAMNNHDSAALPAPEKYTLNLPPPTETTINSGMEDNSLGNVSRGERI
jgi:hypothetical protein